jgi:hypothetical protein
MKDLDEQIANRMLCNRKIVKVRYLTKEEALEMDWYNRPIAMLLDNGVWIYPSADDEGNDGGALFTNSEANPCIPVMR